MSADRAGQISEAMPYAIERALDALTLELTREAEMSKHLSGMLLQTLNLFLVCFQHFSQNVIFFLWTKTLSSRLTFKIYFFNLFFF